MVQRIQNRNLYTKKTALGGVEKTNLRFMHQKVVEKQVRGDGQSGFSGVEIRKIKILHHIAHAMWCRI